MAVSIKGGDSLGNGMPSLLFQTPLDGQANPQATPYEAMSDGQRFLMIDPITSAPTVALQADSAPITTIVNWTALLRKK